MDEAGHGRAVRSLERLYECAYNLRFPPWVNLVLGAGKLTALVKKPPTVPLLSMPWCSPHSSLSLTLAHSLADPLATADPRAEKPKPVMGLFAPSLSYRSRSRADCIM